MEVTLASQLKAARIERGLSLADAAHATRIPIPRLLQLEANNLAAFGNMAYARSFLRHYSEFLGVDATKFIKDLPEPIFGGPHDYRYLTDSFGPWIDRRVRSSSSHGQRDPSSASARGVYALVLMIVLGICSAVLANNFLFPSSATAVEVKSTVSNAPPTTTATRVKTANAPSNVPFTPPPLLPKLVSLAVQPEHEIREPDVSSFTIKRATPAEEANSSPDHTQ